MVSPVQHLNQSTSMTSDLKDNNKRKRIETTKTSEVFKKQNLSSTDKENQPNLVNSSFPAKPANDLSCNSLNIPIGVSKQIWENMHQLMFQDCSPDLFAYIPDRSNLLGNLANRKEGKAPEASSYFNELIDVDEVIKQSTKSQPEFIYIDDDPIVDEVKVIISEEKKDPEIVEEISSRQSNFNTIDIKDEARLIKELPANLKLPFGVGTAEIKKIVLNQARKIKPRQLLDKKNREVRMYLEAMSSTGIPNHLQVCHISDEVGRGVFLKPEANPLREGNFIFLYSGEYEVIPMREAMQNKSYAYTIVESIRLSKKTLKTLCATDDQENDWYIGINAEKQGNIASLVNHSTDEPNVQATIYIADGMPIPAFIALKQINPGEQLLVNYGQKYWEALGLKPVEMTPTTYILGDI